MKPLRLGLLAAAVISGPPLFRLVQQGTLDSVAALEKAGIVALACAIGLSWLRGMLVGYQADVEINKRRRAARTQEILRMIDAENEAAAIAEAAAQLSAQRAGGKRAGDLQVGGKASRPGAGPAEPAAPDGAG